MGLFNFFAKKKLNKSLFRTRESFLSKISNIITGKTTIDEEVLDNLEEILLLSDVGVDTTMKIIGNIQKRVAKEKKNNTSELNTLLKEEISLLMTENSYEDFSDPLPAKPYIILVVGVNGVGKTTTIGKLAYCFKKAEKKVLLGAADTFRAAAVEQLTIWAKRADVPIIAQSRNTDPASVAFDTVKSAVTKNMDVVLIDTAGRLHNKTNLMNELSKIKRVIQKVIPEAPHEVLLVLDASTGQNAIEQCKQFTESTQVTAIALTKLDGTAKGGVVIGISDQFKIPVKFIGVGEEIDDIQVFNKYEFVDSLFDKKNQ
ncbi:MAG: signal recognition particle-docking protein FtsY [Bacteroidota bacterium]